MTTKTYDINLTAAELETIYFALNNHALRYIRMSKTYGNAEAFIENGGMDYAHEQAYLVGALQIKVGDILTESENND